MAVAVVACNFVDTGDYIAQHYPISRPMVRLADWAVCSSLYFVVLVGCWYSSECDSLLSVAVIVVLGHHLLLACRQHLVWRTLLVAWMHCDRKVASSPSYFVPSSLIPLQWKTDSIISSRTRKTVQRYVVGVGAAVAVAVRVLIEFLRIIGYYEGTNDTRHLLMEHTMLDAISIDKKELVISIKGGEKKEKDILLVLMGDKQRKYTL